MALTSFVHCKPRSPFWRVTSTVFPGCGVRLCHRGSGVCIVSGEPATSITSAQTMHHHVRSIPPRGCLAHTKYVDLFAVCIPGTLVNLNRSCRRVSCCHQTTMPGYQEITSNVPPAIILRLQANIAARVSLNHRIMQSWKLTAPTCCLV